jgi:phage tail-like protein
MTQDKRVDRPPKGWLINYLPDIYHDGEFIRSLLYIFEHIWEPFNWQIDYLYTYFDPHLTPEGFLPWLSTWIGLRLDESLTEEQQRKLLDRAIWLFERQGTAAALREMLHICVNAKQVEIWNSFHHVADSEIKPYHFRVIVHMPDSSTTDPQKRTKIEEQVKRIIEAEKPAYTYYDWQNSDIKWPENTENIT